MTYWHNKSKKKSSTTKTYKTDQEKHNHREAVKGHKTKKHYLNAIQEEEAEKELKGNPDLE